MFDPQPSRPVGRPQGRPPRILPGRIVTIARPAGSGTALILQNIAIERSNELNAWNDFFCQPLVVSEEEINARLGRPTSPTSHAWLTT